QNYVAGPSKQQYIQEQNPFPKNLLLRIIHPNCPNKIVEATTILATDPVAAPVIIAIDGLAVGPVQPPVQPTQPAQMVLQEQTLIRQVIQPIADTIQSGKDMERHQTHQKQMDVSWKRSPPSPNINTQFGERLKGYFPPLDERMNKDLVQQHRTAWDLEGHDLVDWKSRHSDPLPAGYAEGNVQIRPFIEAHNRGHRFYIHEYQAFWKEYCYNLFKRKPLQSDMTKDSPRTPG
ncbi:MAG: hypothetical protein EZS28_044177, partial [Streblomastix strix]